MRNLADFFLNGKSEIEGNFLNLIKLHLLEKEVHVLNSKSNTAH